MKKPLIILKLGSSSVISSDGKVNRGMLSDVARQVADLQKSHRVLLVSSGAVGTGKPYLPAYSGKMEERKAAAAIGNPLLMQHYAEAFSPLGIATAQTLCERRHFSDRPKFLQLRSTLETLWKHNILPIANENDVVSDHELKFSDNDELATLMAVGFGAKVLLLGTSVEGVLDQQGRLVREIGDFSPDIMDLATGERSEFGLGGMVSKLTFARLATRLGIEVVIFGSYLPNGIENALLGKAGTRCLPRNSSSDARKKWLASGSIVSGKLLVDAGAGAALLKRKSLLSVGVSKVLAPFSRGEVIEIFVEGDQWPLAVARTKFGSEDPAFVGQHKGIEVAHANDIVLL